MKITDKYLNEIFWNNIDYDISKIYEAIYHDDYQLEVARVNIIYLKKYLLFIKWSYWKIWFCRKYSKTYTGKN